MGCYADCTDEYFSALEGPYLLVVLKTAATLFCCEAPHTFWGLGFGYDYEAVSELFF